VRAVAVVVPPPALDHDLGLRQRVEDLAVEQLVPEPTSLTPIARTASATGRPCAVSTSTCRSLATISSAVCRFLAILASSSWRKAIPQGGPILRGQATAFPYQTHTVLTDNGMAFADLPKNRGRYPEIEAIFGGHIFDRVWTDPLSLDGGAVEIRRPCGC
jgi:hypothetical protein